ncbi:MAG: hypothetical protein LBE20_02565 [Deltaproteobacteria bacterium]|jgi:uncharacterized small protein (DUF1192 family)|nr:hypothetical protein [Deltaproteobacteria bacterium]
MKKILLNFFIIFGCGFIVLTIALPSIKTEIRSFQDVQNPAPVSQNLETPQNNIILNTIEQLAGIKTDVNEQVISHKSNTSLDLVDDLADEEQYVFEENENLENYLNWESNKRIAFLKNKIRALRANREKIKVVQETAEKQKKGSLLKLLIQEVSFNSTLESFYLQEISEIKKEQSFTAIKNKLSENKDESLIYLLDPKELSYSIIGLLTDEIAKEKDNVKFSNLSIENLNNINSALDKTISENEVAKDQAVMVYNTNTVLKAQDTLEHTKNIKELITEISYQNQAINNQILKNLKLSLEISLARIGLLEAELKKRLPRSRILSSDLALIEKIIGEDNVALTVSISSYENKLAACEREFLASLEKSQNSAVHYQNLEEVTAYQICMDVNKEALNLVEDLLFLNKLKKDFQEGNLKIIAKQAYYDDLLALRSDLEQTLPFLEKNYQVKELQLAIWKRSVKIVELKMNLVKDVNLAITLQKQVDFYKSGIESYNLYLQRTAEVLDLGKTIFKYAREKTKDKK